MLALEKVRNRSPGKTKQSFIYTSQQFYNLDTGTPTLKSTIKIKSQCSEQKVTPKYEKKATFEIEWQRSAQTFRCVP